MRVAHFSTRAQLVSLDAYTKDDLPKAMISNDHDKASEILATISHELTHWADLVGTVWGRGHLKRIYHAYRLATKRDTQGSEINFPILIELYDEERRLSLPDYYSIVTPDQTPHSTGHRWVISFSAGLEINPYGVLDHKKPILFVIFSDHDSGELLIRQPFTVAALLETIAVNSEMVSKFGYISTRIPQDERTVSQAMASRAFLDRLYTPELTLYSAPTHMLAHYARIGDAAVAYRHAARISHLCLNLTDAHFDALRLPSTMRAWAELFQAFRLQRDRGLAFAIICHNIQKWNDDLNEEKWLDSALVSSGLPNSASIMADAIATMGMNTQLHSNFSFNKTEDYMLTLGVDAAKHRIKRPEFSPAHSLMALGLVPPAVDSEGELIKWPDDKFDFEKFDPDSMVNLDYSLEGYIRTLLKGCR